MREIFSLLFPIMAMTLGIGVAFWAIYWEHQAKRLQYEERRLMIEKGMAPPPMASWKDEDPTTTPRDYLRRGTIFPFVGVGLWIASLFLGGPADPGPPSWVPAVAGVIVGLLGLGNLVYYFIARNRRPFSPTSD